jgi:hypothetical protein
MQIFLSLYLLYHRFRGPMYRIATEDYISPFASAFRDVALKYKAFKRNVRLLDFALAPLESAIRESKAGLVSICPCTV